MEAGLELVAVRRGKAQNSRGRVNKPTRQLTLQPVAAEASSAAMPCSKPLVQKARENRGSASQQAVIRMNIEQVPKPSNVDADPVETWGRLPSDSTRAKVTLFGSTGGLVTACWQEEFCSNTGDPAQSEAQQRSNRPPARAGQGWVGSRRGPYYRRSRIMPVEGRGLGSRAMQEEAKARRLA